MLNRSPIRPFLLLLAAILPSLASGAADSGPSLQAEEYVKALESELAQHPGVRPAFAAKVILVESHGQLDTPDGRLGEIGAMQIRPQTFAWVSRTILHKQDGELNPRRPQDNLAVGVALLGWLLERYDHNEALALIGYNAGMGTADEAQDDIADGREPRIPRTTRAYIRTILGPSKLKVGPAELLSLAEAEPFEPVLIAAESIVRAVPPTCSTRQASMQGPPERVPVDAPNVAVLALVSYRRRIAAAVHSSGQDAPETPGDAGRMGTRVLVPVPS